MENLGPGVVLKITESLKNSHCLFFFYNFLSSPSLIVELYERRLYGIGTAGKDRKRIPEMPIDRRMKRGDFEYLYSDEVTYCKWLDRCSVTMLFTNVKGMATISTVPRRQEGSELKIQINCPGFIKIYSKEMGGVGLIDQRVAAHVLDPKSTIRFYLHIFFALMDVACPDTYIFYNMIHPYDPTLLELKTIVKTYLVRI